jgi:esterase/lipase superfamily enzyme
MSPNLIPSFEAPEFWAVPLTNSDHRKWVDRDESSDIIYEWKDVETFGRGNFTNIAIAVAQRYPDKTQNQVQQLAYGIYHFPRLRIGVAILGTLGKKEVRRVGKVVANDLIDARQTRITVLWEVRIERGEASKEIFEPEMEIQKVSAASLKKLDLPFIAKTEKYYDRVAYGASPPPKFEVHLRSLEEPKEDTGGVVTVFFGTNRNKTGLPTPNHFFGDELTEELHLGVCRVSIPRGHVQGDIERPGSFFTVRLKEDSEKHIVLESIAHLSEENFIKYLNISSLEANEKSAMVFIHGYNTSFSEAAWRTAQIVWDVPYEGVAGFFSWPAGTKKLDYLKDVEMADSSVAAFENFISDLIMETEIEKIHLIAHSMGNRLMTIALNNLSRNIAVAEKLKKISQIVLAAADIDQNVFRNTLLPQLQKIGAQRTLYSSDSDRALFLSEFIRSGLPRLGEAGKSLFVANGIDTVDASNIKSGGNRHSYIFDTKELLSDLFYILTKGFGPLDRRLKARKKSSLIYWLFPQ